MCVSVCVCADEGLKKEELRWARLERENGKNGYYSWKHTQSRVKHKRKHTLDKPQIVYAHTHASSFSSLTIKTEMIFVCEKKKHQWGCSLRDLIWGEEGEGRKDTKKAEEKEEKKKGGERKWGKGKRRIDGWVEKGKDGGIIGLIQILFGIFEKPHCSVGA